jgi:hypothetical protein
MSGSSGSGHALNNKNDVMGQSALFREHRKSV